MITRTTLGALPADERAELDEILAEARARKAPTPRFESYADEASFIFYFLFAISIGGLFAYLFVFGNPLSAVAQLFEFGFHPESLLRNPALLVIFAPVVAAYSLWRILANFAGNGWALASFGFVHVYRKNVRIVRYPDITKVEVRRFKYGKAKRRGTHLDIVTRDGSKLGAYAGSVLAGLRDKLPPGTPVLES